VKIKDVPAPVLKDHEVLVKAASTTVNSGDPLRIPRGMARSSGLDSA
jgi:hypothetical protein